MPDCPTDFALPASDALPASLEGVAGWDLHMHSRASDGALTPTDLVDLCHARGLTRIALTDHDTLDGVTEARERCAALGLQLIPAAELSCQWRGIGIHIVALLPQGVSAGLNAGLLQLAEARTARSREIAHRLEKIGLDDGLARARREAGSERPLGRPDFAAALVTAGLVPDRKTAFKRYLGAGKRGDVKTHWPALESVVGWIRDAGGVAVVAHPLRYGMTRRKRDLLFSAFIAAGGEAAELVSGYQNPELTRDLSRQLAFHGLYGSLGSDFHYPGGALAPGTLTPPPRSHVVPIWRHPALGPLIAGASAAIGQASIAPRLHHERS
ncbi:PHP domain-containing protein [Salinicola avicenniae]|uniref:PHP domain-containing protein n=1 Tax=Salinicola avicenniae TaxID=2916836 RepID=UPI002073660F|nr:MULTISPECIES: PHP domain-containing protein [unclassified Salinicola]